jgi:hypothetical protein
LLGNERVTGAAAHRAAVLLGDERDAARVDLADLLLQLVLRLHLVHERFHVLTFVCGEGTAGALGGSPNPLNFRSELLRCFWHGRHRPFRVTFSADHERDS